MHRFFIPALSRLSRLRQQQNIPTKKAKARCALTERRSGERRRHDAGIQYRELRVRDTAQAAGVGVYDLDYAGGGNYWSPEWLAIVGLSDDPERGASERIAQTVHPEDRKRVMDKLKASLDSEGSGQFEDEHRVVRPDGTVRWVKVKGRTSFAGDGPERRPLGTSGIVVDITDYKQAQTELETSRARLVAILDSLTEGVVVSDLAGNVLNMNPVALRLHGFEDVAQARRRLPEFIDMFELRSLDGRIVPLNDWPLARVLRGESFNDLEVEERRKDGADTKIVSYSGALVRDADGHALLAVLTLRDVSDRKSAEQALRESEEVLRATFEQAAVGICHISPDGHFRRVNRKLSEMVGYSEDELRQMRFVDIAYPPDREIGVAEFKRTMMGEISTFSIEKRYQRRDKAILWVRVTAAAVRDRDSGPVRFNAVIIEDITEYKRAEQALQESERRLALALEAGGSAVWDMDVATDAIRGSDRLFAMLGYAPGELATAADWMARIHDDDRIGVPETIGELIQGQRDKYNFELRLRAKDGSWRWILAEAVTAERDAQGRALRLVGAHTDITKRKAAEAEIQRLNAELEERVKERTAELERTNEALLHSNMELQHFAHAAAHDLQTPLRSIAGFAQLLQREIQGCVDPRAEEWASLVVDNVKRLQALLQDLLAYTRLDAQGLPFEPIDLRDVVDEVMASLALLIQETGAEISCGHLPTLSVDRIQIAQVLQNLTENGIKYNQSKPPRVSIACDFQEDEWVFSVADNGIGIDPRHHERIFEIFRRLHTYNRIPGTGIGLALCRRIVERHGGRIWVESEVGKGSVFYFSLPLRTEDASGV